jgi:hypothetical protein
VDALRGLLARLPETAQAPISVAAVVSVEARCAVIRALLAERGVVPLPVELHSPGVTLDIEFDKHRAG